MAFCSAELLRSPQDDSTGPNLRSGIYALRSLYSGSSEEELYIVYWPEDTTWDDNAVSSVRRNRITFMRSVDVLYAAVIHLMHSRSDI